MDWTFCGLISGLSAGIAMNIWNLISYYFFHSTKLRLLDWAAILSSGEKSQSLLQAIAD